MTSAVETSVVGRARKRGRLLELTGADASPLAQVRFGNDVQPARAVITSPAGMWTLERVDKTETAVRDATGTAVAAIDYSGKQRHIVLAGGERIPFATTGVYAFRRYRLGDDLLIARATWWVPGREFSGRVSPELAARPDHVLLIALASTLAHWRIAQEAYMRSMQDSRGLP